MGRALLFEVAVKCGHPKLRGGVGCLLKAFVADVGRIEAEASAALFWLFAFMGARTSIRMIAMSAATVMGI